MRFTIEIRIRNTEGALERILGKLRQRSFALCALVAGISPDQSSIDARITVEGTRAAEPVLKQLDKVYDVLQVKLQAEGELSHAKRQFQKGHAKEAYVPV